MKGGNAKPKHKFVYESWNDGHFISLKQQKNHGRVCSDELDDGVRCNRDYIEGWEKFRVHTIEDVFPIGELYHDCYIISTMTAA